MLDWLDTFPHAMWKHIERGEFKAIQRIVRQEPEHAIMFLRYLKANLYRRRSHGTVATVTRIKAPDESS